jgi:ribosomal 50S subunit-recycling heat shock protein
MNKINLKNHKNQPEVKPKESLKLNQNKKIVSYNIVQLQSVVISSFEIRIQSSSPR